MLQYLTWQKFWLKYVNQFSMSLLYFKPFSLYYVNTLTVTAVILATGVHWQPRNMFENKRATSGKNLWTDCWRWMHWEIRVTRITESHSKSKLNLSIAHWRHPAVLSIMQSLTLCVCVCCMYTVYCVYMCACVCVYNYLCLCICMHVCVFVYMRFI